MNYTSWLTSPCTAKLNGKHRMEELKSRINDEKLKRGYCSQHMYGLLSSVTCVVRDMHNGDSNGASTKISVTKQEKKTKDSGELSCITSK
jgi:hypothetical protein